MLRIENINKIFGRQLYSKWIPGTYGWAVSSVEEVGNTYIFELVSNGRFKQAEIQLRREFNLVNGSFQKRYELWAWNLESNRPEVEWYTIKEMDTVEAMVLRLGIMLERIIPTNS